MTRERLELLTLSELKRIASSYRIEEEIDRETLIGQLLDFFAELSQEREEGSNFQVLGEARKYVVCRDEEIEAVEEDGEDLPRTYNDTHIVALVRGPQWAFIYWDVQISRLKEEMAARGLRRVVLRVCCDDREAFDIPLKETDSHRYLHLPRPACRYVMELVAKNTNKEHVLARSNAIRTPRGSVSAAVDDEYGSDDVLLNLSDPLTPKPLPGNGELPHRVSDD